MNLGVTPIIGKRRAVTRAEAVVVAVAVAVVVVVVVVAAVVVPDTALVAG